MSIFSRVAGLAALLTLAAAPVAAQSPIPDLRGTWKGNSETVVLDMNSHHAGATSSEPRFTSQPFTLTIDKQDGRRFTGTFASPRATETVIGVVSRSGAIFLVDDDGHSTATLLAPNRLEICYVHLSPAARIASCTEFTKP
jgi:hypothetical protein